MIIALSLVWNPEWNNGSRFWSLLGTSIVKLRGNPWWTRVRTNPLLHLSISIKCLPMEVHITISEVFLQKKKKQNLNKDLNLIDSLWDIKGTNQQPTECIQQNLVCGKTHSTNKLFSSKLNLRKRQQGNRNL